MAVASRLLPSSLREDIRNGGGKVNERTISVGINVSDAKDLPDVGRYLAKFLRTVDHEHGPFDVNLAISVSPTETSAIGPVESPQKQPEQLVSLIGFVAEASDDDGDYEGEAL